MLIEKWTRGTYSSVHLCHVCGNSGDKSYPFLDASSIYTCRFNEFGQQISQILVGTFTEYLHSPTSVS